VAPPLIPGSDGEPEAEPGILCLYLGVGVPPPLLAHVLHEPQHPFRVPRRALELVMAGGGHCTDTGAPDVGPAVSGVCSGGSGNGGGVTSRARA